MIRLFAALRPPAPIRDAILDLQDGVADARWQDDAQLHLTLRFIGEVERPIAEELAVALTGLHARAPSVRLAGTGAFGGRGRPGVLWTGIEPAHEVAALHRKVDQLCVRVGLEPERRAFKPHVTMARLPRGLPIGGAEVRDWLARHAAFQSELFTFDCVVLFRSQLGRAGAVYEPVVKTPLAMPTGQLT